MHRRQDMGTDVTAGALGNTRLAGASKGVSLTTVAAFTPIFKGTKHVTLVPRNFATAVVLRYIQCPYLVILKSDRAVALDVAPIDCSEVAQDGSTTVPRMDLSGLVTGRFVYVGAAVPFRGAHIDVEATNGTSNTDLVARYWAGATDEFVDLSATDGTKNTVALDKNGPVTWTMPTAERWKADSLVNIMAAIAGSATIAAKFSWRDVKMYWTRWQWDEDLDSTVTLNHMIGINESQAYDESPVGLGIEQRVHHGFGLVGTGGFETLVDAGTGNVLIKCATLDGAFSLGLVK